MKKRNMIILLILLLTIGFASVSTTLVLNGTIGIGLKNDDFEVIFVEALLDGTESSKANIGVDKKTITFNTNKLTNVGDTTELVYKVKNNSTQYGANVTMTCNTIGNEYVSITSTFDTKPLPLAVPILMEPQEVRMGRITAELIKGYSGEDNSINIECTINASATEDDTIAEYVPNRYREDILNGTDPVLASGLVPITIENDGTVKKADITSEWYDYETKKWANAVILEDESVTYNSGEVIPENNIESYFVWIPKYSYQLWDLGNYEGATQMDSSKVHNIPIKFGLTNTDDTNENECTTPLNPEDRGNCQIGDYMTHPAFITMGTNGLWVGKFETGYKGATTIEEAENDYRTPEKIEIKPNVYSWGGIQVASAHLISYNYQRNLDSHLMKNTEWGAVAYLQYSDYGSASALRLNNNFDGVTGYAAVNKPTCGYTGKNEECNRYEVVEAGVDGEYSINYKNPNSQIASTTGNYTGIYDMSGGRWEFVMGIEAASDGKPSAGSGTAVYLGFNGLYNCPLCSINDSSVTVVTGKVDYPVSKYYDLYKYEGDVWSSTPKKYYTCILGDATCEMGPFENITLNNITRTWNSWGSDGVYYSTAAVIFVRGGSSDEGTASGIFGFDAYSGSSSNLGYRIVLAP